MKKQSIINARSCAQSDVQAAINTAIDGDVVDVPAGSCTWNSMVDAPNSITIRKSMGTIIRVE